LTAVQPADSGVIAKKLTRGQFFFTWLPTLLWLCVIAIESTDWLSSHHTSRILYPLFHWLFGITPEQFAPFHAVLRKAGHVVGYGLLSVLAFRSWRGSAPAPRPVWSFAWARNALLLTAATASLDEWHQTFIPSRTGTIWDVLLDTAAGLAAQILIYLLIRSREGSALSTWRRTS
jgi:VanZ family protein